MEGVAERGVSSLWTCVNHIALVVSDVGRSLTFYTDVVGMKQVLRPNFDRHGAWLTFGNVDLHLIKGRPAVHPDDDLIVSHLALTVSNMPELRQRFQELNIKSRRNVSVPNPATEVGIVDQAFVRDPDGYYIEFCSCETLEKYLHQKMAEDSQKYNFTVTKSALTFGRKLKAIAIESKEHLVRPQVEFPTEEKLANEINNDIEADCYKLQNLLKRQEVYGDITQNASAEELEKLLKYFQNDVPKVIAALEGKIRMKGTRTFIPPAFYGRNGRLIQPPSFEMPVTFKNDFLDDPFEGIEKGI